MMTTNSKKLCPQIGNNFEKHLSNNDSTLDRINVASS